VNCGNFVSRRNPAAKPPEREDAKYIVSDKIFANQVHPASPMAGGIKNQLV
jgi:hypothetical protein